MILLREILTSDEVKELKALKVNDKGSLTIPPHIRFKIKKHTKGSKMKLDKTRSYLSKAKE